MDKRAMPQRLAPGGDRDRDRLIDRLIVVVIGACLVSAGVCTTIYMQTVAWQMLAAAGVAIVAALCLILAWVLRRRHHPGWAAGLVLSATIILVAGTELLWTGATLYNVLSGTLVLFLLASTLLPRRWVAWLAVLGIHAACLLVINQVAPVERFDIRQSVILRLYLPSAMAGAVLLSIWQVIRLYRLGTIQMRLLVSFATLALLLTALLTATSVWVSWQNGQRQVTSQLESASTLKEREIQTWLATLDTDMALLLSGGQVAKDAQVLLRVSPEFGSYEFARRELLDRFQEFAEQSGRFGELFVVDLSGTVVLSNHSAYEGQNESSQRWFRDAINTPGVSAPFHSVAFGPVMVVAARPVTNEEGHTVGLVAGRASLDSLNAIMAERAGLGETAETYLVSLGGGLLTPTRTRAQGAILTAGTRAAIGNQANGSGLYENYAGVPVVGVYHWLPELQAVLLAEQEQAETFEVVETMLVTNLGAAAGVVLLAALASLLLARTFARPLANLAETAGQIAAGELHRRAPVEAGDEVGALATAFNHMAGQLEEVIGSLEQRVNDRTADLEQRSRYLQAAAEIGRAAASILDADELISQVVELIRSRFDLYHVGLFLLETKEGATAAEQDWAILRAATGSAGAKMVARRHRIQVGQGMIGWSIAHAEPRITLDAARDAIRLTVPELPNTRSEAALPLRSRGRILGALSIQSDRPDAFNADIVTVLETVADQVAVALDNARLLAESQAAVEATRRAYGEVSRTEWMRLVQARPDLAFRSDSEGVEPAGEAWRPEMEQAWLRGQTAHTADRSSLAVPIKIRGETVGVLDSTRPGRWSPAEVALLEAVAEQLGLALESARLYQDTQRRAVQERLVSEVTARIRETLDVETVLHTAVQEIGRRLELHDLTIRLDRGA